MKKMILGVLIVLVAYSMVAGIPFKIRHPWVTDVQTWARMGKVLRFETLPKSDFEQFQK